MRRFQWKKVAKMLPTYAPLMRRRAFQKGWPFRDQSRTRARYSLEEEMKWTWRSDFDKARRKRSSGRLGRPFFAFHSEIMSGFCRVVFRTAFVTRVSIARAHLTSVGLHRCFTQELGACGCSGLEAEAGKEQVNLSFELDELLAFAKSAAVQVA